LRSKYHYFSFSQEEFVKAIIVCQLIISRAGANTIGEIAALLKASILIPYPFAANNHQMKNARVMEKTGASIIIKQEPIN